MSSNPQWRYHAAKRRRHLNQTKEQHTMSMSRDRVHFELDTLNSNHATRTAFMQAFGTQFPASSRSGVGVLTIICRPSQFARFLIYRNEHGGQNLFKELNAKLVPAAADPPLLDVSGNPAQ